MQDSTRPTIYTPLRDPGLQRYRPAGHHVPVRTPTVPGTNQQRTISATPMTTIKQLWYWPAATTEPLSAPPPLPWFCHPTPPHLRYLTTLPANHCPPPPPLTSHTPVHLHDVKVSAALGQHFSPSLEKVYWCCTVSSFQGSSIEPHTANVCEIVCFTRHRHEFRQGNFVTKIQLLFRTLVDKKGVLV